MHIRLRSFQIIILSSESGPHYCITCNRQLLIHLARARDDVACVSYIMSNQRALHMGLQSAKFCIYSNQRVFIHMDSDPLNSIYISKLKNYQKHNKTNIHENH